MRVLFLSLALTCSLAAQIDTRELVRRSIENGEKAWEQSRAYSYLKTDADKQFGSNGQVKSRDVDVYRVIPVGGSSYEEHIEHNGEPLPAAERAQQERELQKTIAARKRESASQRSARLAKERKERAFYREIPDAFDFKLVGKEDLPTGPAWVLEATPRPGFQPKSRYAHVFPKMKGRLWIDQKDTQWVKADAVAMDNVYFGYFVARLAKGSHIVLQQTRLPDGLWAPKQIEARASARTFVFFNHNFEETITYSDYRKQAVLEAKAARSKK